MVHTLSIPHMITQQQKRNRTIVKEKDEENVGQKISVNKTPVSRSIDNTEKGQDGVIRTRYGRVVRKPNRLVY